MADELRTIRIHGALNRPDSIAGCERELVLFSGLIAITLVLVVKTWAAVGLGIAIWSVGIGALRKMGKKDPVLSKVYLKHIKYKQYYPAHATAFAPGAKHSRR